MNFIYGHFKAIALKCNASDFTTQKTRHVWAHRVTLGLLIVLYSVLIHISCDEIESLLTAIVTVQGLLENWDFTGTTLDRDIV